MADFEMSLRRLTFSRAWLWPLLFAGLIFFASGHSRVSSVGVRNEDKYAHFLAYGLLATLVCRLGPVGWRAALCGAIAASFYGLTDEFHQSFVPGRSSDVMDWVADTTGAILAVGLYTWWGWYRRLLEWPLWTPRRAAPEADRARIAA